MVPPAFSKLGEEAGMIHVIINPEARSGRGKGLWEQLEEVFREQNAAYQTHFTHKPGDAGRYAGELTEGGEPVKLLVCGGDGTLNEVLQGIRDLDRTELCYIPYGSANDFARDFEQKGTPQERLRRILHGGPRLMDVGLAQVKGEDGTEYVRRFAGSSGIGFDAAVCEEVNRSVMKRYLNKLRLGKLAYLMIALRQLILLKQTPVRIIVDGEEKICTSKCLFSAFMIHRYEGGGFMFCPDADASDGILDLCEANDITRHRFLRIMPSAFSGKHVRFREVHILRGSSILVQADSPMYFHVDGEVVCRTREVRLSCLKQKLRLSI